MIVLTGKNLRERQKELNVKVNDAAKENVDFNNIKHQPEISDVDKLFKIDLAAKYKNVEYILEIFRSGDPLYISRALNKCTWLCDNDFAHVINKDYLSNNIFPLMSIKMIKKLLTIVATNINDDKRTVSFYSYCMQRKLHNIALKFLLHTPESFKMGVIIQKSIALRLITEQEGDYLKNFIGESFPLAENYVKNLDYDGQKSSAIYLVRHLYSLSNDKYLNMVEACDVAINVFGRRLSKHIIQNNKARVMKKPLLYANLLNKNVTSRNCSIEDAQIFAVALLPEKSYDFFTSNYYANNQFVLNLIPAEDKYSFIKNIFTDKYPGETFEKRPEFYTYDLYNMMTMQERETWAINNIVSQDEILARGKDYLWYKFVNFDKALIEVKKHVMKTKDNDTRCEMLKVLIDSAKTEDDLTTLLNYFCDRHMNEVAYIKDSFVAKLAKEHKILHFGDECWMALEKIFYRLEVFDKSRYLKCKQDYRAIALMYYIIHGKPVLGVLKEYIDMDAISLYDVKKYEKDLTGSEKEMIFQYLIRCYAEKVKALSKLPYDDDTKQIIRRYLNAALDLCYHYDKTRDDIPEIIYTYLKLDWSKFKEYSLLTGTDNKRFSSSDIMHYLKEDAELAVSQFSKIKYYFEYREGNINWLLNKLKIFFAHDISKKYLTLLNDCINAENLSFRVADVAIRGILVLADEVSKVALLKRFVPKDKKIDCHATPMTTLYIQRAICRQMRCSRPPLPLSNVMQFVTGDYVQHCLSLFHAYMLNLPFSRCLEFVESLIDKPISIQKHGLRLALECFDEEKIKTIILDRWSKTKNVSLRLIIYKSLFMRVLNENGDAQLKLFEVLVTITSNLNEDDDDEIFRLIRDSNFPDHMVGRYLESGWNTLSKFSVKPQNLDRMADILNIIERRSLSLFPEDALDKIIDNHVSCMLDKKEILKTNLKKGFDDLIRSKWNLIISNLVYVTTENKLDKSLKLAKHIIKQCIEMWDEPDQTNNMYVVRHFLKEFINDLHSKSYEHDEKCYSYVVTILQSIKEELIKNFQENEIYMLCWNLDSSIITKEALVQSKEIISTTKDDEKNRAQIRRSGILLGSKFGLLIQKYIEKGKIYSIFYEQIASVASNMVENFHNCISKPNQLSLPDVYVLFCFGLLEVQVFETYMIATKLLPNEYEDEHVDDYLDVLKKIQAFPNRELQCYMYEKFVNTDFKIRKYIDVTKGKVNCL